MTDLKTIFSCTAVLALALQTLCVTAQDDLDDLLKDLEDESSKPAASAPAAAPEKPAPKAEEPAAEEAKPAEEEKPAAEEEKAAEEEPAAAEEPVAKASAEGKASSADDVDEVLNLLDALAAEEPAAQSAAKPAAAAPVAAKPAPKKAKADAELLENIATTERLRRSALDEQAQREIRDARASMDAEAYTDAIRHYGLALKFLNDSPKSAAFKRECDQGVTEGLYRAALQEDAIGRRAAAIELMQKAYDRSHPKANEMLEKWRSQPAAEAKAAGESDHSQARNDEDYKKARAQYRRRLRRSRQYLALRDMKNALDECESVLRDDPYNQEAIRLRNAIQKKRQTILEQERQATRDGMIADVDEGWRPVYAVNASQLSSTESETVKSQAGEDPERTQEQNIEKRMREMRIPEIDFKPPATIIEAVEFFRSASRDYDRPDIPIEKRGFNFVLRTPVGAIKQAAAAAEDESNDFSSNASDESTASSNGLPPIPMIKASDISFYDALKLVCDSVDYKFIVRGPIVMVLQKDMSTAELLARKYNVPAAFGDRVDEAYNEIKESGGFGSGNALNKRRNNDEAEEGSDDDKWKAFFEQMGVKWPEGSSIKRIKSLGKLYVRNTRENLAEFEKVLDELGGQPQLIEIETRFVEVSQEDLNSLGFEWILNNNLNLSDRFGLGKALGLSNGGFIDSSASSSATTQKIPGKTTTTTTTDGNGRTVTHTTTNPDYTRTVATSSSSSSKWTPGDTDNNLKKNIGVNAFGGTSDYGNGNRYLSTSGNHISGEDNSTNDQFLRVNAFLGEADLSMILHMLSQRSDTDLLSAPKVVTKSGEQAIIKVVTEYIYPTDYDVQLQSSSSGSSGSSSGGSQSAILAVVEPQNFTMREVGVILDVTPTYSEANGGTIDLELKPAVVDEPTWKNYGMQIPFTGNTSSGTMADIGNIFTGMATALEQIGASLTPDEMAELSKTVVASATDAAANVSTSSSSTMTWYDAPMEQPFFHVRSIDSKVSITPGSTVVMGGLITESRKAMDDKVPFLGDLPFIGRLFRSHAEQTTKRNLLIFVTGRLITPSGRELTVNVVSSDDSEVKPAPSAE